jgi:hypothetical protein
MKKTSLLDQNESSVTVDPFNLNMLAYCCHSEPLHVYGDVCKRELLDCDVYIQCSTCCHWTVALLEQHKAA